jgi:hypothetical protein
MWMFKSGPIRADKTGHAADINEKVYSRVEFCKRKAAVNLLEKSLVDSNGLNPGSGGFQVVEKAGTRE